MYSNLTQLISNINNVVKMCVNPPNIKPSYYKYKAPPPTNIKGV